MKITTEYKQTKKKRRTTENEISEMYKRMNPVFTCKRDADRRYVENRFT